MACLPHDLGESGVHWDAFHLLGHNFINNTAYKDTILSLRG